MEVDLHISKGKEGKMCRTCEWQHHFEFSPYPSCLNKRAKEYNTFVLLTHGCDDHVENKRLKVLSKLFR